MLDAAAGPLDDRSARPVNQAGDEGGAYEAMGE
jgi:hypothetical protein